MIYTHPNTHTHTHTLTHTHTHTYTEFDGVRVGDVRRVQSLGRGDTRRPMVFKNRLSNSDDEDYDE